MSVSSVTSGVNTASLNQIQEWLNQKETSDLTTQTSLYGSVSSKVNSGVNSTLNKYGAASATSSVAQAAIQRAISEMADHIDGPITFSKIQQYQQQLEEEFSLTTRAELYMLGVDLDTEFTLNMSSTGQISVNCNDPQAKAIIEQYLSDNPDACDQFGYIQALSNLERARQSPATLGTTMRDVKMELQASAIDAFMNDTLNSGLMDYSGILASFDSGSETAKFYTGLSFKV